MGMLESPCVMIKSRKLTCFCRHKIGSTGKDMDQKCSYKNSAQSVVEESYFSHNHNNRGE